MQSACAVLYFHLWPACVHKIYPHYPLNGTISEKKVMEHKMCVLIFSTNVKASSYKVAVILVRFKLT
jgi:hypothetical protein